MKTKRTQKVLFFERKVLCFAPLRLCVRNCNGQRNVEQSARDFTAENAKFAEIFRDFFADSVLSAVGTAVVRCSGYC